MLSLALEVLSILAPSGILALIGVIWYRKGPDYPVEFVSTLVINIGLPALLFYTLATSKVDILTLGEMAVAALLVHLILVVVSIGLLKLAGKDWRLCVAMTAGNTGNLGLPVCYFAFGEEGLLYAMAFFSVQMLLLFSLGDAVYAGRANIAKTLRSPVLIAIVAGVTLKVTGIALPEIVADTTELLGQLVIPIMLITLGVSLAGMRATQLPTALKWAAVRIVLTMLVAVFVVELMGITGVARGVLIIETIVPVAVLNFLLLVRHEKDPSEVSSLILVTHLSAVVYLPIVLAVLLS